jgi:radical SAM protein with 4Fe4S-binding SPASM domain
MHDSPTYESEVKNEMDFDSCIRVIDDFNQALNEWGFLGKINFSGGDPLLREDLCDLISYANVKGIQVGILGNPDLLTIETAKKLKDVGVSSYQISIDGTEKTQDMLRKKGAFKMALKGLHVLKSVGIAPLVMFTLSKMNAHELIEVIQLVEKQGAAIKFDFARLVPMGTGANLKDQMLTPEEYRKLLLEVLLVYEKLGEKGGKTEFGRKDHLWWLLYQELGVLNPLEDNEIIYSGCAIGIRGMTILSDGTVLACRRLPTRIGKVPDERLRDIFNSTSLNNLRQIGEMEKCASCDLIQICRGCPAVAYGANGRWTAPDPQCWKQS